ncbi:N-acetylmuramic acid 6-phosphate etherase [Trinickia terrae]|uniref:N-acetylmuramic acid 6-phosphate etherase n=1 Tax=Trinickia terrae TaxID=2571161 RepID=A0A4U1IFN6_9BURK|nr:N-acetylmuramic acid 6-phosphate etherase [Trinickia terrae]TKC92502.1 N-acetylmuramic acid 6-phosphate etherase [Trinickia terrae]
MDDAPIPLNELITEQRNPASERIDRVDTLTMLRILNAEDQKVALAAEAVLPAVATAVDAIAEALSRGGRLIYVGAGTSGRLGILDASECPPTFGVAPAMVQGLIAGGPDAIVGAIEFAEDDADAGQIDLQNIGFRDRDILVGIAASGRTPYVIGAMKWAASLGARTISITCNPGSAMASMADIAITPVVGPEAVTGSSRLKAGTVQKLILNMLSTGAMIRLGKVFGNLMVDVEATSAKLIERQIQIVIAACGCSRNQACEALELSEHHCKTAIVMIRAGVSLQEANAVLERTNGHVRAALDALGAD